MLEVATADLTLGNLVHATRDVIDTYGVGLQLGVPVGRLEEIKVDYSTVEERRIEVLQAWINYDVNPTWRKLQDALRMMGKEVSAARIAEDIQGKIWNCHKVFKKAGLIGMFCKCGK